MDKKELDFTSKVRKAIAPMLEQMLDGRDKIIKVDINENQLFNQLQKAVSSIKFPNKTQVEGTVSVKFDGTQVVRLQDKIEPPVINVQKTEVVFPEMMSVRDVSTREEIEKLSEQFQDLGQVLSSKKEIPTKSYLDDTGNKAQAVPVSITNWQHMTSSSKGGSGASGAVTATQSGTWNITNISGTVSLPTGAATSANQSSLLVEMQIMNGAMAMQVDDAGGGVIYQGWAEPGTATSAASWRIRRITSSGTPEDTAIVFADGNRNFDNVWSNRTGLSYS